MAARGGRAGKAYVAGPSSLAGSCVRAQNEPVVDPARAPFPLSGSLSESRLAELDVDECVKLLSVHHIGRVAVVVDGQPLIFPVNYAMAGHHVVFRSDPGTKLHAAVDQQVAFEIDGVDGMYHSGWSVLVVGTGGGAQRHEPARARTPAVHHVGPRTEVALAPDRRWRHHRSQDHA